MFTHSQVRVAFLERLTQVGGAVATVLWAGVDWWTGDGVCSWFTGPRSRKRGGGGRRWGDDSVMTGPARQGEKERGGRDRGGRETDGAGSGHLGQAALPGHGALEARC